MFTVYCFQHCSKVVHICAAFITCVALYVGTMGAKPIIREGVGSKDKLTTL